MVAEPEISSGPAATGRRPLRIAFVGTYPPRQCGIATFTHDLRQAMVAQGDGATCPVVAIGSPGESPASPPEVICEITGPDLASYERAAEFLNRSGAGAVSLQHEFGIFGGSAGGHVLALLRGLTLPVVTTLHTVLRDPSPEQRRVMEALIQRSARLVVMTERGTLLRDEPRRLALRQRAHRLGRAMLWSKAAAAYAASFARARHDHAATQRQSLLVRTLAQESMRLPRPRPDHVLRLSDSTGILQHARYTVPDRAHGYCTDDNARALLLVLLWQEIGEPAPELERLATTYTAFLAHALHPGTGRFRNFMGYDRRWLEEIGSEDSHGRALWALGVCSAQSRDRGLALLAGELFTTALPAGTGLGHPRTWACTLLGLHARLQRHPGDTAAATCRTELTARLLRRFEEHARDDWHWLADDATYDNAKLPHALILSGRSLPQPAALAAGLRALDWLLRVQTAPGGGFQPIGSDGFCHRNGTRARFDQQPIEVQATVSACLAAFHATADQAWLERAHRVFAWFLGRNDLGLMLYDAKTGGCRDALHADRVNENQGAESTLAFHLALAELQSVHHDLAGWPEPRPEPRPATAAATAVLP